MLCLRSIARLPTPTERALLLSEVLPVSVSCCPSIGGRLSRGSSRANTQSGGDGESLVLGKYLNLDKGLR